MLRALLDRGIRNVALGMIWDPQTVSIATTTGVGARLTLRIGGKVAPCRATPLILMSKCWPAAETSAKAASPRCGFDPIAAETIYADTPGTLLVDLSKLPYKHLVRPIWPMD